MIDNGMKLGYFAGFMKFWKPIIAMAAACFAGGFWETMAQEWLRIHYTDQNRNSGSRAVSTGDTRQFVDASHYSVNLPAGLRYLVRLNVRDQGNLNLTTLKLPKDIGIDASIPFRLNLNTQDYLPILQLHKDMRAFYLFRGQNVLRIPPMQDLIQNLEPDDDGLIRTVFHGVSIEVYGVPPRLTMKRRPDGVEISWKGGVLQSASSIDGPWKDVTYGAPRWLFLKSSQPAEFFRVKP